MAGERRGGYLDGRLNLPLFFLAGLQRAKEEDSRGVGKGGGKSDDLRGRERFTDQGGFQRGDKIGQRPGFGGGRDAVFDAEADAFDLEQAARFQRSQGLAGNGQGERNQSGQLRNALRLFADELGEEAEAGGVGKNPAGSPQRRLNWFSIHLPYFAKYGSLCPSSKQLFGGRVW